jgi:hypothetical protein
MLSWFQKLRVTLVLNSGVKYVFLADKITTTRGNIGLSAISWSGASNPPHFIEVQHIDLIETRTVSRWHRTGIRHRGR